MTIDNYLALFPGSTREKPKFIALAEAVLRQVSDLMSLTADLQSGFSFAAAEGVQLDDLAAAVGLRRETGMTDEAFRQYLLAKLALWGWDGTNETVPAVFEAALSGTREHDNRDGTVTVTPSGVRQDLLPVPAGIRIHET